MPDTGARVKLACWVSKLVRGFCGLDAEAEKRLLKVQIDCEKVADWTLEQIKGCWRSKTVARKW